MTEILIGQMEWAIRNINNNLDFIPDDKLDWRPAPTAKSALETVNHAADSVYSITQALGAGEVNPQFMPAANRQEAKVMLQNGADAYIARLRLLTPQDLERVVTMPFGEMPLLIVAGIPVVEIIHHNGQIAYIQTLLGDAEDHLVM